MKTIILATVAILALAPAAFAAPGGNGKGGGRGAAHGNDAINLGRDNDRSSGSVRANRGWTVNNGVTTNPGGHVMGKTPPGQAKKMNGVLANGSVLPASTPGYRVLDARQNNLPAAPAGYEYVRVGNDTYLRQANNGVISSVVQNLFR